MKTGRNRTSQTEICVRSRISQLYIYQASQNGPQYIHQYNSQAVRNISKDPGSVELIEAQSPIIQLHLHSSLVEKEPYQRLGMMEAAQTGSLTGI